jgi:hypothetical protein
MGKKIQDVNMVHKIKGWIYLPKTVLFRGKKYTNAKDLFGGIWNGMHKDLKKAKWSFIMRHGRTYVRKTEKSKPVKMLFGRGYIEMGK